MKLDKVLAFARVNSAARALSIDHLGKFDKRFV